MTDRARRVRPARPTGQVRLVAAGLVGLSCAGSAIAQLRRDPEDVEQIQGVTVTERLGDRVPAGLRLTDPSGDLVPLSRYFDGERPVLLALVYFGCPVVCPLVMDRLTNAFRDLDYTIGEDYNVLFVSIDHAEGPTESDAARMRYTTAYGRHAETVGRGWGFLTGDEQTVRALADACGWGFKQLSNGEFSHPAAVMVLSPEGVVSRYVYGFDYPAKQVKLSLLEASQGRIAESLGDKIMFYCYRFDPGAGAYTMEAMAVMRVAGVLTVVGLTGLIGGLFAFERIKGRATPEKGAAAVAA